MKSPTRADAEAIFLRYNSSDSLVKHGLAVEAVMRHMARKHGEDEEKWGVIGLVHDLDYEKYPEQHCAKTKEILEAADWPEEYVRAVISHGWGFCNDVEPISILEKVLYAVDELTGLVTACVLVRPSRSIQDLTPKSVKKKWKDKRFAAGVNREVIEKGAAMLGLELGVLIAEVIEGMKSEAGPLGLDGTGEDQGEGV